MPPGSPSPRPIGRLMLGVLAILAGLGVTTSFSSITAPAAAAATTPAEAFTPAAFPTSATTPPSTPPSDTVSESTVETTIAPPAGFDPTATTHDLEPRDLDDCIGMAPGPNCGSSGRGGWRLTVVFALLVVALGFIAWRIRAATTKR